MKDQTKSAGTVEVPINLNDQESLIIWAQKLDATPSQIRDAVDAVGSNPADVELHLKGSRSSTNSERVAEESH